VRAVVVGQHYMEEEPILEHPTFRRALGELGLAAVWVTPAFDMFFRFDKGTGERFEGMMAALARELGYQELEFAPVVPIGHSMAASFPWNFAAWNPVRTLAAISVSGQWPYWESPEQPAWGSRTIDGVPGLISMGEYEEAESRSLVGLKQRQQHPGIPLSMLAEPAGGHFDVSDEKVAFLALYLKKAVEYRLPADGALDRPVALKPIDPTRQGWLASRWRRDQPPLAPAAAVGKYTGDERETLWWFDEEIAQAAANIRADQRGKEAALLGYIQDGQVVPQDPRTHQQVTLRFLPVDDGLSFMLRGTFLGTVPKGRPEQWTGLKEGTPIGHAQGGSPVAIGRICGPVEKRDAEIFAIRFDRVGTDNPRRSNEIWLLASHPGDDRYKRAVQQSALPFPLRNTEGADQHITFPAIPDQPVGTRSVEVKATCDSGAKVSYYVLAGPAELEGDTLKFTPIPTRSRFPVKVTVVAWQWGRSIEPKRKSANPVQRAFSLVK
jgi:hypothetical protein